MRTFPVLFCVCVCVLLCVCGVCVCVCVCVSCCVGRLIPAEDAALNLYESYCCVIISKF